MIGYYTNNTVSHGVMQAVAASGNEIAHINDYSQGNIGLRHKTKIFYGILRGAGTAMKMEREVGNDFVYIDNGYFDAKYVNSDKVKDMTGKYRVVRNDMVEPYRGKKIDGDYIGGTRCLLLAPSPYSANYQDTIPEEWLATMIGELSSKGYKCLIRDKNRQTSLDQDLDKVDFVVSFNSMAIMRAIERGMPAYDSYGILRNTKEIQAPDFVPKVEYDFEDIKDYYKNKQFTLKEIAEGKSII